jgi:type IV pilus assembly protein PilP
MDLRRHCFGALLCPLVGLSVALVGCDDVPPEVSVAASPSADKKTDAAKDKKGEEAAAEKLDSGALEYAYSPVGKRDPFRSVLDDLAEKATEVPSGSRDCGPLCKWELDQLRLVAVISGLSNPLAMVEDPKGKGFVIRRGTFMGKHNGKVTQIRTGEIIVTEIFKDQMGKPHANPRVIKLPADKRDADGLEDQNLLGPEATE